MDDWKLFHTAMVESADLMAVMPENHGIKSRREFVHADLPEDDLDQEARVFVPVADYERAHRLFYGDSEDEI